jgi:hypothetical protein
MPHEISARHDLYSPDGYNRLILIRNSILMTHTALLLIPALGGPERKIAEVFPLS